MVSDKQFIPLHEVVTKTAKAIAGVQAGRGVVQDLNRGLGSVCGTAANTVTGGSPSGTAGGASAWVTEENQGVVQPRRAVEVGQQVGAAHEVANQA